MPGAGAVTRRTAGIAVLTVLAAGCATAQNYLDSSGPVFAGQRTTAATGSRPDGSLRLVTFNIKWGEQALRAADLLNTSPDLREADIVFLQEMDRPGVERMADALAMNYAYVPSAVHPVPHRDFGVAILSKWPLTDVRKLPLPRANRFNKLRRSAASATVGTAAGQVRVYAVHLETPFGANDRARREQARAVLADATTWGGPVIVAGDFNGAGGPEAMAHGGFRWVTRRVGHTTPLLTLDEIFLRGLCLAGSEAVGRGPKPRGISDHRPVWAVVTRCG